MIYVLFFFNYTATTEIYTLSLHDALPISRRTGASLALRLVRSGRGVGVGAFGRKLVGLLLILLAVDRKSTRLNSSHANISYAVFCLKKKKQGGVDGVPIQRPVVYTHRACG